jgi:tetratricopeptide (TPR) repeat protein
MAEKAEAALANHDADALLAEGKALTGWQGLKYVAMAYLMQDQIRDARKASKEMLTLAQSSSDSLGEGEAWLCLSKVYLADNDAQLADALEAADKAKAIFANLKNATAQAKALAATGKAYLRMEKIQAGVDAATEALSLFRSAGDTKGMADTLEVLVQAYAMKANPMQGLQLANKELAGLSSNKAGQADILEMIMHQHAVLGEPYGALKAGTSALEIYRSTGDKMGEASVLHTMAEMYRVNGQPTEATKSAELSLKIFKGLGSKWGEDQALQTLSLILVERGIPEKAPKRPEALKILKEMVKAIEVKNADQLKNAQDQLEGNYAGLMVEKDYEDILHPALARDPEAIAFLEGLGWEFKKETSGGKTTIKMYPHRAFYLHMLMGGMGFGPQFRPVNPYRVNSANIGGSMNAIALSIAQLPETEAWQMELGFRPGILDSGLQCQGTLAFP